MSNVHLLIDARNVLYRSIWAIKADRSEVKYHCFTIFLRQLTRWMNLFNPSSVHVFWDAPRNTVWRRKILKTYKNRVANQYSGDISEDLRIATEVAQEFFSIMNVRQYSRSTMEADDMIYAATSVLHPNESIIISSDSDMIQIPFYFSSSKQYDPSKKSIVDVPKHNPAIQKALVGDKSDIIEGYNGIGPKKSAILLESHASLRKFLDDNGSDIFNRNLLLIDLSLCQQLLHNRLYVQKRLSKATRFSGKEINELIIKHKVNGLLQEYNDLIPPFEQLK